MAGIGPTSGMGDALDVLTVVHLERPEKELREWRARLDRAEVVAQAKSGTFDRRTWGLQPHQIEQQRAAMRTLHRGR